MAAEGVRVTRPGLVSVVLPTYNYERYLAEAIESAIAQSYPFREIIVVDDGSTDGTRSVAERYPEVRYVFQDNAGIGAARNAGIALAEGEFLTFLDADDSWPSDRLERMVAELTRESALDMVFGHVHQFPTPERAEEIERTLSYIKEPSPAYLAGTVVIRRTAFDNVGPFLVHLQVGEFVEWYLRAIDLGLSSAMLTAVVLRRRLHNSNQGIRMRGARLDYVRIVKARLDRKRAGQ